MGGRPRDIPQPEQDLTHLGQREGPPAYQLDVPGRRHQGDFRPPLPGHLANRAGLQIRPRQTPRIHYSLSYQPRNGSLSLRAIEPAQTKKEQRNFRVNCGLVLAESVRIRLRR